MDTLYLVVLGFLLILAIFDLSVGVANDAVNFLSPAVGARAAKFKTILGIAAVGIFIGAATSSGMMDIARNGILQPTHYTFADVMCVFLAVCATDVILLDIFNTLGMPTSTTVSMVFGLIGGSTALAFKYIINDGLRYSELINTDKALTVIFGIFLSVAIAFVFGLVVMWLTRVIFTFNYKKHSKYTIGLYGGFSIALILFFLLTTGLRNAPFMKESGIGTYVSENPAQLFGYSFVASIILVQCLHFFKVNIFKIIILFGTFSLAMAFAGNDLVNFIGVPLAGLEGFLDFYKQGDNVAASSYFMNILAQPSTLPGVQWYLIGAGLIMTFAICTSKKAQQVVQNTINLSSQNENEEVFSSSKIARLTVRSVLNFSAKVVKYVPQPIANWVDSRFNKDDIDDNEGAFDLVRASVNLVLAGLLITIGTSFQLPLSTTYVAFMVAMGSSLADRAWGRETAVYRITGVITVIGGWFITAGAAFIMAFLIASLNNVGGFLAMVAVIVLIVFILIGNNKRFKKRQAQAENVDVLFRQMINSRDETETWNLLLQHCQETEVKLLQASRNMFKGVTSGLMNDHVKEIKAASVLLKDTKKMWKRYRKKEILVMRKIDRLQAVEKNTWFYLSTNSITQLLYGLRRMSEPILEHVDNNFNPLPKDFVDEYLPIVQRTDALLEMIEQSIKNNDFTNSDKILVDGNELKVDISNIRHALQDKIHHDENNLNISLLYLNALQETQELVSNARHLIRAAKRFSA